MTTQQLTTIEQKLTSSEVQNRLVMALGLDIDDEQAQKEAFRFASSVITEIQKTAGDPKKDLTGCNPDSIVRAMVDAAQLKIGIDGRQHAHLVKYNNAVQLQIGYRGYIAKLSEYLKDVDFTAEPVFNGDELKVADEGGFQTYTLKKKDPFASSWDDLQGVAVQITYSRSGEKYSKVTTVSKADIKKMRGAAKQDFIWAGWPIEKAKAAAIKRACKVTFANIQGLQDMIRYDNENNFDPSKLQDAAPTRKSIVDNINSALAAPQEVTDERLVGAMLPTLLDAGEKATQHDPETGEILEPEIMVGESTREDDGATADDSMHGELQPPTASLEEQGNAAAAQGTAAYSAFFKALSPEQVAEVKGYLKTWNAKAKESDNQPKGE